MNMVYRDNPDHPWSSLPRWKKRLSGFTCYSMCAVVALFYPEMVDLVLHKVLRDQFKEDTL